MQLTLADLFGATDERDDDDWLDVTARCPICGRVVITVGVYIGFKAACGRRLIDITECGTNACVAPEKE
jgi:hypothetical protein